MSTKSKTPTTREGIEARIAESRAFLNQRAIAHSRVDREFLRHAARRATITKAERAAGQPLDQARREEWDQTMKALEKTSVVTLGDVAAVLDMLRRETREHKPTTRRDRLHARLLNSASETVKAFHDAMAWCHPFHERPAYAIHPRAARLMAAEVARVMEARDEAEKEKVKADSAEFARLLKQIGTEGQEYMVTLLALQNVSSISGRALAYFVHDEDRDYIARGLRRQLADVTRAVTEQPSPADDNDLFALWTAYTTARAALNAHKGDDTEGDRLADVCRSAELAFLDAPARTAFGVALKFQYIRDEFTLDTTLRAGLPADVLKALDTAADAVECLASQPIAQPDTFADTIAAFEAEAPGMLSVPQIPTEAMEKAATQLAGITPEQFRYAYAAALEAFTEGRAA